MPSRKEQIKKLEKLFEADTPLERSRLIQELEEIEEDPLVTARLRASQLDRLARMVVYLPADLFQVLALYYGFDKSPKQVFAVTGVRRVQGTAAYCRDRLSQLMELGRPIGEDAMRKAVKRCLIEGYYMEAPALAS